MVPAEFDINQAPPIRVLRFLPSDTLISRELLYIFSIKERSDRYSLSCFIRCCYHLSRVSIYCWNIFGICLGKYLKASRYLMENDEEVSEIICIASSGTRSEAFFEEVMINILLWVRALVWYLLMIDDG